MEHKEEQTEKNTSIPDRTFGKCVTRIGLCSVNRQLLAPQFRLLHQRGRQYVARIESLIDIDHFTK
jgi:hypothetical protein